MARAVLFDVGGPIDTEMRYEAAIDADIRAALGAHGVTVDDAAYRAAEHQAVECFAANAYQAIIWTLAGGDVATAASVGDAVSERARHYDYFDLRPGIAELIRDLHARGVKLGLAANQPARIAQRLAAAGLAECFAHREVSGTNGLRKPDLRVFLVAAAALGTAPGDCIMVGDRIDNDIAPARALGMRTVRFVAGRHAQQRPRSWLEVPEATVDDVTGLARALAAMLEG
jgi:HAD superfamily hydrolase (TIGR01509 family)